MTTPKEQEMLDATPAHVTRSLRHLRGSECVASRDLDDPVIAIDFQLGPVKETGINGCQLADVLDVLIARLEGFQRGPFACVENTATLSFLHGAKRSEAARTARRKAAGTEGTNQGT